MIALLLQPSYSQPETLADFLEEHGWPCVRRAALLRSLAAGVRDVGAVLAWEASYLQRMEYYSDHQLLCVIKETVQWDWRLKKQVIKREGSLKALGQLQEYSLVDF